jgi:peptide/nickel transport system permease protein
VQGYIGARLLQAAISLVVVSIVVFVMVRLIGDPLLILMPPESTPAEMAAAREAYGLDRSWPEQYAIFVGHALQGDFGRSLVFRRPALDLVGERYAATLELGGLALLLSLLLGVPLGVYSAVHRGTLIDHFGSLVAAFGQAMPPFLLALGLILIFGVTFRVLPTSGIGTVGHIVLPAATLVVLNVAGLIRLTRSSMLNVLSADYVKLARIKGLPEHRVIWKHAFINAAQPVLTFTALLAVTLLNGVVVVETVFNWPGLGLLIVQSAENRDYPVVQTVVLLMSAMYLLANLVADLLYAYINPRIRYS